MIYKSALADSTGCLAALDVMWLILSEPDVKQRIRDFINGINTKNSFEVVGPMSYSDNAKLRENPRAKVRLPVVTLIMKMVTHHLTGQLGVHVSCSEEHLTEIGRWKTRAMLRRVG